MSDAHLRLFFSIHDTCAVSSAQMQKQLHMSKINWSCAELGSVSRTGCLLSEQLHMSKTNCSCAELGTREQNRLSAIRTAAHEQNKQRTKSEPSVHELIYPRNKDFLFGEKTYCSVTVLLGLTVHVVK